MTGRIDAKQSTLLTSGAVEHHRRRQTGTGRAVGWARVAHWLLPVLLTAAAGLSTSAASAESAAVRSGCPVRFDEAAGPLQPVCVFVGSYNRECGGEAAAMFSSDGVAVVVFLTLTPGAPSLILPGAVVSATEGKLVGWRGDLNLATDPSIGRVVLDDRGASLRITLLSPLHIGQCPVEQYVGYFAGLIDSKQLEPAALSDRENRPEMASYNQSVELNADAAGGRSKWVIP